MVTYQFYRGFFSKPTNRPEEEPHSIVRYTPIPLPPTTVLVTKPVRIPMNSNHQEASIRIGSPHARAAEMEHA